MLMIPATACCCTNKTACGATATGKAHADVLHYSPAHARAGELQSQLIVAEPFGVFPQQARLPHGVQSGVAEQLTLYAIVVCWQDQKTGRSEGVQPSAGVNL